MVSSGLPLDHPGVKGVIVGSQSFVGKAERKAEARPNDINAWNLYGDVALSATVFDLSYYDKAENAYRHALKLDPNDPRALKGMGNVNYDRRRYDAAISDYERYLHAKPNDPKVLTDLGTMYLAKKNVSQALKLYREALAIEPNLFSARFNSAVGYLVRGDKAQALAEFQAARKIAPDAAAGMKVEVMLARLEGRAVANVPVRASAAKPAATFRHAIERVIRTLPSEGPRVASVEWPSQHKAIVVLNNSAIGAMPASEKTRFLNNVRAGIVTAKVAHNVSGKVEIDFRQAGTGQTVAAVTD